MYFLPLYETFNEDKKYIFQIHLPLEKNSGKVLFEITLSLNEEISKTNKFLIRAERKIITPSLYAIFKGGVINTEVLDETNIEYTLKI